jgi:hypothetical protein
MAIKQHAAVERAAASPVATACPEVGNVPPILEIIMYGGGNFGGTAATGGPANEAASLAEWQELLRQQAQTHDKLAEMTRDIVGVFSQQTMAQAQHINALTGALTSIFGGGAFMPGVGALHRSSPREIAGVPGGAGGAGAFAGMPGGAGGAGVGHQRAPTGAFGHGTHLPCQNWGYVGSVAGELLLCPIDPEARRVSKAHSTRT